MVVPKQINPSTTLIDSTFCLGINLYYICHAYFFQTFCWNNMYFTCDTKSQNMFLNQCLSVCFKQFVRHLQHLMFKHIVFEEMCASFSKPCICIPSVYINLSRSAFETNCTPSPTLFKVWLKLLVLHTEHFKICLWSDLYSICYIWCLKLFLNNLYAICQRRMSLHLFETMCA